MLMARCLVEDSGEGEDRRKDGLSSLGIFKPFFNAYQGPLPVWMDERHSIVRGRDHLEVLSHFDASASEFSRVSAGRTRMSLDKS